MNATMNGLMLAFGFVISLPLFFIGGIRFAAFVHSLQTGQTRRASLPSSSGFRARLPLIIVALSLCGLAMIHPLLRTPSKRAKTVAVLDFFHVPPENTQKFDDATIRKVVSQELRRTGEYTLLPESRLKDLLTIPEHFGLRGNSLQRLGEMVNADYIVSGEIIAARFLPDSHRANVKLDLKFYDTDTNEWEYVHTEGYSPQLMEGQHTDDPVLLEQALGDAVQNAIRTITSHQAEATVVATSGTDGGTRVSLDCGIRQGIAPDMDMIVVRNHQRIGRIRVTKVRTDDADAAFDDDGLGIQPGDQARSTYREPCVCLY